MTEFTNFFSSPNGVAIAWVFTVIGGFYGLIQKKQANAIKVKYEILDASNNELKIQTTKIKLECESLNASNNKLQIRNENLTVTNTTLEQKIIQAENNDIHDNYQEVTQTGKNNVNQGVVKGDVSIEL
ncbi:hypothetical protein [uncultured Psychromonas sp.]|uniref:hypothetical protein n=1 Tax=uncultured Psychromonas sp. TaxID=173974 RepID=UPI0026298D06|nr:hypothetical protein [uncultured Psychromonas sp.]